MSATKTAFVISTLSMIPTAACSAQTGDVTGEDEATLNQTGQAYVDSINGLTTVNGLITVNGLTTVNGLPTVNGLTVDCAGGSANACTGKPDGILSATKGLMSNPLGEMVAKYMIRCALADGDAITIADYTGAKVTLAGEVGLAPSWKTGKCDSACQEYVSACLMAFTNGLGNHVDLEMAATAPSVGTSHSSDYPYQEAAFFGNLFTSPPSANYCVGDDYEGHDGTDLNAVDQRACKSYVGNLGPSNCPYKKAGNCNATKLDPAGLNSNKCSFTGGAAAACGTGQMGNIKMSPRNWSHVITTYRKDKGAT